MKIVGIIPARLGSTRLPRKMLLRETGRPLVQHTWEAVRAAKSLSDVILAIDSEEMRVAAKAFGARCEMTGVHASGTDRIAEVARRCCPDADVVLNIQGDEPLLEPDYVDRLAETLVAAPHAHMATLAAPLTHPRQLADPACVKVVCDRGGRAMYFSRAPIPFARDGNAADLWEEWHAAGETAPWRVHIGVYAYRPRFLQELTALPVSALEQIEKLEQLRALEAGATIQIGEVPRPTEAVDTPEDYARFVRRWRDLRRGAA